VAEDNIPSISDTPVKPKGTPNHVQNAFNAMRRKRTPQEEMTVTIGDTTTVLAFGTPPKRRRIHTPKNLNVLQSSANPSMSRRLRAFAAEGSQLEGEGSDDDDDIAEESNGAALKERVSPGSDEEAANGSERDDTNAPLTRIGSHGGARARVSSSIVRPVAADDGSDDEYVDDAEKKAREEARVAQMIADAEQAAARPTQDNIKRATSVLRSRLRKDSTLRLVRSLNTSINNIEQGHTHLTDSMAEFARQREINVPDQSQDVAEPSEEERLSLTVGKSDFSKMRVVGQFNLGFIIASRPGASDSTAASQISRGNLEKDHLFIIDQHASDEKYNFERLQAVTVVQNQRLVHPRPLELTAIEEEAIINHSDGLAKNGFVIETDTSGEVPVGQRCRLLSLPMSKEVVFDTKDLEELLHLLGEQSGSTIPRPSKVRKMFAMRACRSSIMVGKTLHHKQMASVVRHMGEIDKPWNCPHGRPTMRHLFDMGQWSPWKEGDGLIGLADESQAVDWKGYMASKVTMHGSGIQDNDVGDPAEALNDVSNNDKSI